MLKQAAILLAAVGVLVGCSLLLEKQASPFFQSCISESDGNEGQQSAEKRYSSIGPVAVAYMRCSGRFLDSHGAGITALFTIILAVSTILLWFVTNKAAEAAKIAAEHIPRVERAYLFVTVKPVNLGVILTEYTKMTDDNLKERIDHNLVIEFSIENQGKTPAIIKSVSAQIFHYKTLPDEPGYGAPLDLPKNRYLAPGKETDPSIMIDMLSPTYNTVGMLMRGESALWFYGRVTYYDIFGGCHEHRFCWRFSSGYFLPYYRNEEYIKNA
jgi:hypothetical protein